MERKFNAVKFLDKNNSIAGSKTQLMSHCQPKLHALIFFWGSSSKLITWGHYMKPSPKRHEFSGKSLKTTSALFDPPPNGSHGNPFHKMEGFVLEVSRSTLQMKSTPSRWMGRSSGVRVWQERKIIGIIISSSSNIISIIISIILLLLLLSLLLL